MTRGGCRSGVPPRVRLGSRQNAPGGQFQLNSCIVVGMENRPLSTDVRGLQADVLDHAFEFVECVFTRAPAEYQRLIDAGKFSRALEQGGAFNHGKLFVYAEFAVFRREFGRRFPDATAAACINAFSGLFLKNDISIHNLIEFIEGAEDTEQLRLNTPGSGPQKR